MTFKYRLLVLMLPFVCGHLFAQHHNTLVVDVDFESKILTVEQEITYYNQTTDTLNNIILNDWNNGYSDKDTPLAKRFSDEYVRAFHLAKKEERGSTLITSLTDQNGRPVNWERLDKHPDIVRVQLNNPIYPGHKFTISASYQIKIPSDRFTEYGYNDNGRFNLKDWYLSIARYEDGAFVKYSNENLNDIANAVSDYEVTLRVPTGVKVATDLYNGNTTSRGTTDEYYLIGEFRNTFALVLEEKNSFEIYRNRYVEINNNMDSNRVTDIQKAVLINDIVNFTYENLGANPQGKILVTEADYKHDPFYGLNQLPSFLSPFPDSFLYEIRFLKTYLNNYLHNTLKLDPRKDAWVYDGIQVYLIMKYIEQYHPEEKMMGQLSGWPILRSYNLFKSDFNGQYNYLYLLMARKNLDQPIGNPKNTHIKFNEQIAGKYRAGLSLNYLDDYTGNKVVEKSVQEFIQLNNRQQTSRTDFENILKSNTDKDISWFFTTVIETRKLIDFKFGHLRKEGDSIQVTIKNKTGANVPVSLYALKDTTVVFKKWLDNITVDSTLTLPRYEADRLVLNYKNEIPEFNRRNNWKKLRGFLPNEKPIKFTFFQDLENPDYNQIFYVPSFIFNVYDGFSPGLRFHNKSLLEKPFIFDIDPTYSIKTGNLIGSFSLLYNQYIREQELYSIRYGLSGSTFHYAPDAKYTKFTPYIQFRMRDSDYRKNKKEYITARYVMVDREQSAYIPPEEQNENYSVFNVRYGKFESEIIRHYNFYTDVQLAGKFGKVSGEIQYRRLFNNNRQINLRFFAGAFMYRDTSSEFFSFGLDRPTDYLFDYNYYGRSETSGLFSRQYIQAEGGFKSIMDTRYANQWMTTVNASFNIWHWLEVYGDAGLFKNKYNDPRFVYDSGIRFNILPDYFELYFPVYSTNGFEINDAHYDEKIRFVVTISPKTLIDLFTRKWF